MFKIPAPMELAVRSARRFNARVELLLNEGHGPWLAVIGLAHIILAVIYLRDAP